MVMGPTHAASGVAAWLAGSLVAAEMAGYRQSPVELATYTAVCAGAALLPDLDCSGAVLRNRGGATVARSFGVVSLFLAECVEKLSLAVYRMTRTRKDGRRTNGHRTLTHTWAFNLLLGLGVAVLAERHGKTAAIGVLFFTFGLAVRGLMAERARQSGWLIVTLFAACAALLAANVLPTGRGYPLLGVAVAAGGIVHTFGDMVTRQGCPVLWPLPLAGEVWYEVGVPDAVAVKAGGRVEKAVLLPGTLVVSVLAGVLNVPGSRAFVETVLAGR